MRNLEPNQRRRRARPSFVVGILVGACSSWVYHQVALAFLSPSSPPPSSSSSSSSSSSFSSSSLPWRRGEAKLPHGPLTSSGLHAIIIPAGGQGADSPPSHVEARLERALELYVTSPTPKPYIITTAWGTPHKPCPHDAAGFERHEAADNARYLINHGVPPSHLLEESLSLETVGNAYFTRLLHTEIRGLRRLAIVNNAFHMARTKAVFTHVFEVPLLPDGPRSLYELRFEEVEDRLPPDVLEVRRRKEASALPKFSRLGPWQRATPSLRDLHAWVFHENTAYAAQRLLEEKQPIDPALLKSY